MNRRIHIVEAGGRGGEDVVLHAATDPEVDPADEVVLCRCVDWQRHDEAYGLEGKVGRGS
jgi:hypothetical protein